MDLFTDEVRSRVDNLCNNFPDNHATILYGAVVGSNMFGLSHAQSDYDLGVIYAHPSYRAYEVFPPEDYKRRTEIGKPPIDMQGLSIRSACEKLFKSDLNLIELMRSPFVFKKTNDKILKEMTDLVYMYAQPKTLVRSYLGIANNATSTFLIKQTAVGIKKYFLAVRPLLSAIYIQQLLESLSSKAAVPLPPVDFELLLNAVSVQRVVRDAIEHLYKRQKNDASQVLENADLTVLDWIQSTLFNFKSVDIPLRQVPDVSELNLFIHKWTPNV